MTERDLVWADVVLVMERKHRTQLCERFGTAMVDKTVHVLDVPDDYGFMDPDLVELLEESVRPLLT